MTQKYRKMRHTRSSNRLTDVLLESQAIPEHQICCGLIEILWTI